MLEVAVDAVTVRIGEVTICHSAGLVAGPGRLVGLVGPNGSGKTTLLRTIYRALRPTAGAVLVGGDDLARIGPREAARRTAVVAQEERGELDFEVVDVVNMGRIPHVADGRRMKAEDHRVVEEAMARMAVDHLADRCFSSLSGGERQRVMIARALAQRAQVLVLDEPTNHLDVHHQLELMATVAALGVTVVMAIHDLNLAMTYAHEVVVMDQGRTVAAGPPREVLTVELVGRIWAVAARLVPDAAAGRAVLVFGPVSRAPSPAPATVMGR